MVWNGLGVIHSEIVQFPGSDSMHLVLFIYHEKCIVHTKACIILFHNENTPQMSK